MSCEPAWPPRDALREDVPWSDIEPIEPWLDMEPELWFDIDPAEPWLDVEPRFCIVPWLDIEPWLDIPPWDWDMP
jgi:hypothetical protein